jgi:hypothetical protein
LYEEKQFGVQVPVISRVPSLAGNVVARRRIRGSGHVVGKQEVIRSFLFARPEITIHST